MNALRMGLRDHGYVEGKNINLVFRWAETAEQLPGLAAELVRLNVDVLVAPSSTEVEAVRSATTVIPIVFTTHADPVGVGHVASLARPGGNITGLSGLMTELVSKQLEIMTQALPRLKRIGVLAASTAPSTRPALHALEAAAQRLGVQVLSLPVRAPEDFKRAFEMMARERVDGFLAVASPLLRSHRAVLAQRSPTHRLAGMFGPKEHVEVGGLMCYFPDQEDLARRAGPTSTRFSGSQTSRPAGGAGVQVRVDHQFENCQQARDHDRARDAPAGRSHSRMTPYRPTSRSSGPELAVLAPAAERGVRWT